MERERSIIGKCQLKITGDGDVLLGFINLEAFKELGEKHGKKGTDDKIYVRVFIKRFKSGEKDKYGNTHTIDVNIE